MLAVYGVVWGGVGGWVGGVCICMKDEGRGGGGVLIEVNGSLFVRFLKQFFSPTFVSLI